MVYLHVPFCRSFCTYCGFYSEKCTDSRLFDEYAQAVIDEISRRKDEIEEGAKNKNTIYIGGGTPSVLPPSVLGRIVKPLLDLCSQGPVEEFTVEVNPDDIIRGGKEYVSSLLELGVGRISMGVQSFDDEILRWMGRRHDSAGAIKAYSLMRETALEKNCPLDLSIDLIFGIPGLTEENWLDTVEKALSLGSEDGYPGPEHISAYQLSIEEGSTLERMIAEDRVKEASDHLCRRQYDILCQKLSEAGYRHYEISNFAVPGHEAVHNSAYWDRIPYVGLGPGAHSLRIAAGRDGDQEEIRSWNSEELPHRTRNGLLSMYSSEEEHLSKEDIRMERLMLSLRTDKGIEADILHTLADKTILERMLKERTLVQSGGRIRIPEDCFFISDDILRKLA